MTPITNFRGHMTTVVVTFAVAVASLFGFLALGGFLRVGGHSYTIKAIVPSSSNLTAGARVTMAGVEVGRVSSVKRHGTGSLLELTLTSDKVTPLPADSHVGVRVRTPIGENYVSINRGTSGAALKSGDLIGVKQADDFVDVDQILSVMQGTTAQRTRQLIQGLAGGLAGRGKQLNQTLSGVHDTFVPATRIVDTLDRNRQQVSRLVAQLGDVSSSLAERDASIRALGTEGLTAFRAIAARDDRLRALLHELPATLAQAKTTTSTLGSTTHTTAPVLANLARALHDLRPAVRSLLPAAHEGRAVLTELGRAAPRISTTLDRVDAVSKPLASMLPQVHGVLCQVNPMLAYLEPYLPDLNAFIEGWVSSTNSYDALGHVLRVQPIINTTSLVGASPAVARAAKLLQSVGAAAGTIGKINYDPYPGPGLVGKHSSLTDAQQSTGIDDWGKHNTFQRVERECNAGAQPRPGQRHLIKP